MQYSTISRVLLGLLLCLSFSQCRKINNTEINDRLTVDDISPTGGKPGTPVTIKGSGFSLILSEDTVLFNGTAGEIQKTTDTSIEVIAPKGGTTGKVTVMVRNKSAEGPVFTYLKADQPQITGISPKAGWDYTLNTINITGKNFGNDRNQVIVTLDGKAASIQSFSSTKIVAAPPKHAAGKVSVMVKVDGIASNAVNYIYQQKPEITNVVLKQWHGSPYYFLSVSNLAKVKRGNTVTLNGEATEIDSIFRAGSSEYNQAPKGEKLLVLEKELLPSVYLADFIVTCNGIKSDAYRFTFDPYINMVSAEGRERDNIAPGDTAYIYGHFFGKHTGSAKVELWNTPSAAGRNDPDPEILKWDNTMIEIIVPSYTVRYYGFTMQVHVKTNGKDVVYPVKYIKSCSDLDEVYTGEYQYPGGREEPYGIQLNPDGTMMFSSAYDDYTGTYNYDCSSGTVTMDFAGHGVIVSATREGNALTHFTFTKSAGFNFLNGYLNTTWNQNLNGTRWSLNPPQGNSTVMTFSSTRIQFDQGMSDAAYTRKAGTMRFTIDGTKYFATIDNDKMEGESSRGIWNAVKK